ncbi:MAG: DUF1573 domain-containing protein [candidate division Zixibacteria bacterium]|nr:DUF1573 domain-containing protein [candidate division Zixibacteria bacterium]
MLKMPKTMSTLLLVMLTMTTTGIASKGSGTISVDKRIHDFGSVPIDYRLVHVYTIANTGTGDLIITGIIPNCDCTITSIGDTVLAPNESTELRMLFYTKDYYGQTRKTIMVTSTDPVHPTIELEYRANIGIFHRFYTAEPKSLFFLPSPKHKTVTISNSSDKNLPFTLEVSRDSIFTIACESTEIKAGKSVELDIAPREDLPKGTHYGNFTVIIDEGDKVFYRLTVPIKIVRY